jgi:uncharacterized membrane protein
MTAERLVARVLLVGGVVSLVVVFVGLTVYTLAAERGAATIDASRMIQHAVQGRPATVYSSLGEIARGLTRRPPDPLAVIALGLVLLAVTPVVGVAAATVAFARAGDRDYATIGTVVLLVLVFSFALAAGAG